MDESVPITMNSDEIERDLKKDEEFGERGRGDKVQNWPHILLKNNA